MVRTAIAFLILAATTTLSACDFSPAILNCVWVYDYSYSRLVSDTGAKQGIWRNSVLTYKLESVKLNNDTTLYSFAIRDSGVLTRYDKSDSSFLPYDTSYITICTEFGGESSLGASPFYQNPNHYCGTLQDYNGRQVYGITIFVDAGSGGGGGNIQYIDGIGLIKDVSGFLWWYGDTLIHTGWNKTLKSMEQPSIVCHPDNRSTRYTRSPALSSRVVRVDVLGRSIAADPKSSNQARAVARLNILYDKKSGVPRKSINAR
jgi:hypothetical protein